MSNLGDIVRRLREEKYKSLDVVATELNIEPALLNRIEEGQHKPTKEQVLQMATYFKVNENDLLVAWLSDKLEYEIEDDQLGLEALQLAEEKIAYRIFKKIGRKELIRTILDSIQEFRPIEKAWIYGSFSREDDGPKSDIDIAIKTDSTFSYFDLAEVQYQLEKKVKRKIDIGFVDSFKPYIFEHLKPDLKLIYERAP